AGFSVSLCFQPMSQTSYPVFRYERFELERTPSRVTARFTFSIAHGFAPDISFSPEVHFESVREGWNPVPEDALKNAIFHLGLIEAFSYWKATASPVIEVHAGSLNADQIRWWEDLLIHGMGEFFYRNDIDFTSPDFVKINPSPIAPVFKPHTGSLPQRSLLTIGGGR